jgi:DNA ligase-1
MTHPLPSLARRRVLAAIAALPIPSRAASDPRTGAPRFARSAPQLASVYAGQVDPARCYVSEKYDGVRALWDGSVLRHRSGRAIAAPASFLSGLPDLPLDGELWLGRGRFEPMSALVRRVEPGEAEWRAVRYLVFDTPIPEVSFEARLRRLAALPPRPRTAVEVAPQWRVADDAELQRALARTVAAGGEGLMLHVAAAPYVAGRSETLLKLKPHLDAEAVVVGHRRGAGKYRGHVGALEVESPDGRRFFVGSGLSDAARANPPRIGSAITYRYRDLTSTGLPRFATFLRPHHPL